MMGSAPPTTARALIDPLRRPAALADAITRRWRRYRLRAYVLGVVAGFVLGGVVAPIATTILALLLSLAGALPRPSVPWAEIVWSAVFVVAFARVGSWAIARWLPPDFRSATETYVWLAMRAEAHWRSELGVPVPRKEAMQRAFLDATPVTAASAGEIASIWLSLGDLDTAREVIAQMPESSAGERHDKAAARWLVDFVAGESADLGPLEASLGRADDSDAWLEDRVELAVDASRVALAQGGDWIAPMASIREQLGDEPSRILWRFAAEPAFRMMLYLGAVGVVSFWVFTLNR
jgi:hypothetical protein